MKQNLLGKPEMATINFRQEERTQECDSSIDLEDRSFDFKKSEDCSVSVYRNNGGLDR